MKHIIEAGCDGATLCAFDPMALPADFDRIVSDDPVALMKMLQTESKFWMSETGADGCYVFHVYIDEPAPLLAADGEVTRTQIADFRNFKCPSGKLWFCGAEYAANDPEKGSSFTPKGGLGAFKKSGGKIELRPGSHRLKIYTVKRASGLARQTFSWSSLLSYFSGFFLIVGGLAAFFFAVIFVLGLPVKLVQYLLGNPGASKGWHIFPIAFAVLLVGLILFGIGYLLNRWHERTLRGQETAEKRSDLPDYVVEIE